MNDHRPTLPQLQSRLASLVQELDATIAEAQAHPALGFLGWVQNQCDALDLGATCSAEATLDAADLLCLVNALTTYAHQRTFATAARLARPGAAGVADAQHHLAAAEGALTIATAYAERLDR